MSGHVRLRYALAIGAGLCYFLSTGIVCASFEFFNDSWDGASRLVRLAERKLGKRRVVVSNELPWDQVQPKDGILILHPQRNLNFGEVSAFLSAGGRLALLDDFGRGDRLLRRFHIERGPTVVTPKESIAGNSKLQVARPVVRKDDNGTNVRHPTVRNVKRVLTNHPTTLLPEKGVELTPVLSIAQENGAPAHLAMIGVIGDAHACGLDGPSPAVSAQCGRLFALADPSLFINLMLEFEGNRQFAQGLVEYLLEDDAWGKREGTLYVLSGNFDQSGHFGGGSTASRTLESTLNILSDALGGLQRRGLPKSASLILSALMLALVAWYSWKTGGIHVKPLLPRYAQPVPLVSLGGQSGRLAVLSANTTHPQVVLLDLKESLEAFIAHRLAVDGRPTIRQLMKDLGRQHRLPPQLLQDADWLCQLIERAEQAVIRSQTIHVSKDKLDRVRRTVAELETMLNEQRAPRAQQS